jgi:hypothetical protein
MEIPIQHDVYIWANYSVSSYLNFIPKTLLLAAASRVHPFCNLQSRAQTHAVLVIGLYELLGHVGPLEQFAPPHPIQ